MIFDFDFSGLIEAVKNVLTLSIGFYKALGDLFVRLWDLLKIIIGLIDGLVNK